MTTTPPATSAAAAARAIALHGQASTLAQAGQLRMALPIWGEALRQDPDNVAVLLGLGHALGSLGELNEAAELAERAARLSPQTAAPWLLLGIVNLEQRRFQQAIESLQLSRDRATADERDGVAVALGQAWAAAGRPAEAADAVSGVELAGAYLLRGHLAAERGDVDGARAALLRAGELEPDHPEPYKRLSALLALTEPGLARELARHALALAPMDPEARALVEAFG